MKMSQLPVVRKKSSFLAFGTARLYQLPSLRSQLELLETALVCGVNHFVFSNRYGNGKTEKNAGRLLRRWDREKLVLSTQLSGALIKGQAFKQVRTSLQKLQTDYLDTLYLPPWKTGLELDRICYEMTDLISKGLIRSWGTCDWPLQALFVVKGICDEKQYRGPGFEQMDCSARLSQQEIRNRSRQLQDWGIRCIGHSPFANGQIFNQRVRGLRLSLAMRQNLHRQKDILSSYAKKKSIALSSLLLQVLDRQDNFCAVLVGTNQKEHLQENILGLGRVSSNLGLKSLIRELEDL